MSEPATSSTKPLWWVVPAATVLLLLVLAMLLGSPPPPPAGNNSYDAGPAGFRAAYLLLDELKVPVTRSRRQTGGAVRWVLYPHDSTRIDVLNAWVRDGGRLLIADPTGYFAEKLGLPVRTSHSEQQFLDDVDGVDDVHRLALEPSRWHRSRQVSEKFGESAGGDVRIPGASLIEPVRHGGQVWGEAGGKPLVTIHHHGRGEIWLLHRPGVFFNENLRRADNAILLCRLADAMLEGRRGQLAFDEFVHGLRDRPGVLELLLRPPMLYLTLASVLFTLILVWHHAPRFGPTLPDRPVRRRSKEEYLDAMAELLQRKGDYHDAFDSVRQRALRRIETDLGLGGGNSLSELLDEVERRRPGRGDSLRHALRPNAVPPGASRHVFLSALNDLEKASDEFSQRRAPR